MRLQTSAEVFLKICFLGRHAVLTRKWVLRLLG